MRKLLAYPIFRVFLVAFPIGLIVLAVSNFLPPVYRSKSQILVNIIDPELNNYQISEIAQRQSEIVKNYFQSRDFITLVLNDALFSYSQKDIENIMNKKFKVEVPANSNVIRIITFGRTPTEAQALNRSSINVLKKQIDSVSYLKEGTKISLKIIENPSISFEPVSPQPFLYALVAFLVVLFLGSLFFIY